MPEHPPICYLCDQPTASLCDRCDRPLCKAHRVNRGSGIVCTRGGKGHRRGCCQRVSIDYCQDCVTKLPGEMLDFQKQLVAKQKEKKPMSVWDQIGRFDDSAKPERGEGFGSQRPGIDALGEGNYEFQVLDAECKETLKQQLPLLVVGLRVLAAPLAATVGMVVEHNWFLDEAGKVNRCWADLVQLGCPGAGAFSQALQAFLPRLPGKRFLAQRKDSPKNNGGTFHNLNITRLVAGAAMPAPAPAAVFNGDLAPQPSGQAFPDAAPSEEEVPW